MLHSRRLFLLLICCLMIFSLSQIAAQDETPTLTPTETFIPTLQPTETATDVPSTTPLPSETPTALPSETPTPLPIPTASETATETPTVEISNSPAPTLTVDASLSPSSTPTTTLTPTVEPTISSSPTSSTTDTLTPIPTITPITKQSSLRQNSMAVQGLTGDVNEIHNIDNFNEFSTAIDTANANCSDIYVLYLSPNIYSVIPEPDENRGLAISGQVVIVGNSLNVHAIDPAVPDAQKVIFQPNGNTGIFYISSNVCGTEGSLSLYNVVLRGGRNINNFSGGAITNESVLNIYNSYFFDNEALAWGGAIMSTANTIIINSVFENNRSTSANPNTGGGAIYGVYSISLSLECTSFVNNSASNVGGALQFAQSATGPITLVHNADVQRSNNFINNTASVGYANIYNESPTLDAAYQHWSPTPSSGSVFGADYSAPLTLPVQPNCAIPPIPTPPITPTPVPTTIPAQLNIADYGVYVAVPTGTDASVKNSLVATMRTAVLFTAGTLNEKFHSVLNPPSNYTNPYQADVGAFKRIMLGADPNQIGFVFANLTGVSIPQNENSPNSPGTYDYRNFGRSCPFYLNLAASTATVNGGNPDDHSAQIPAAVLSVIDANNKGQTAHQAVIVCDISLPFDAKTAVYNFGLVYMYENGGLVQGSNTYYGAFDDPNGFHGGGYITDSNGDPIMGNISADLYKICVNLDNLPKVIAEDGLGITCVKGISDIPDWWRGQQGWGSAAYLRDVSNTSSTPVPNSVIRIGCGLQQNAIESFPWRTLGANSSALSIYEREAAAADMFLNYVFGSYPQLNSGFQNWDFTDSKDCDGTEADAKNDSKPGKARNDWMDANAFTRTSYFR